VRSQRAHATLIGLSSVRRDGDVLVNKYADHSTIKSNFLIGPLVLRVEKAVSAAGWGGHNTKADHWLGVRDWRVA